jgi:hypothetical protein
METVFTNLEAASGFHRDVKIDPGPVIKWPAQLIDQFRTVLPGLLDETVGAQTCEFHDALARGLFTADVVVSLNYDCVIDYALCGHAGQRFAAARGAYGVAIGTGANSWKGTGPGNSSRSIKLLKLHGSLNWDQAATPLNLRSAIYGKLAANVIQPPLANKPVAQAPFQSVWREARREARAAKRLVLIGYSMPVADGFVRTMMSNDLSPTLHEVVLVEPDESTRDRHIEFFTRIAGRARVFAFSTFEEFATALA